MKSLKQIEPHLGLHVREGTGGVVSALSPVRVMGGRPLRQYRFETVPFSFYANLHARC